MNWTWWRKSMTSNACTDTAPREDGRRWLVTLLDESDTLVDRALGLRERSVTLRISLCTALSLCFSGTAGSLMKNGTRQKIMIAFKTNPVHQPPLLRNMP